VGDGTNGADADLRSGFRGCVEDLTFKAFEERSTRVIAVMMADEFDEVI
jgi:hypothetical protein